MSVASSYVTIPHLMLIAVGFLAGALAVGSLRYDRYEIMNAKSKEQDAIVWRLDRKTGGISFCTYVDETNRTYCGVVDYPAEE